MRAVFLSPTLFLREWVNRTASGFPEVVGKQAKTPRCGVLAKRVTKTRSDGSAAVPRARCDYVFGRADKSHPRNHRQCRRPTVRAAVRCLGEARHENKIQLLCIAIAAILPATAAKWRRKSQRHAKRCKTARRHYNVPPHKGIPILADSHIIKPIPISNTEALCMTDFSPPGFPFASSEPAVLSLPTIF